MFLIELGVMLQFFEMQKHDAIKALEIYKRAGQQVSPVGIDLDILEI